MSGGSKAISATPRHRLFVEDGLRTGAKVALNAAQSHRLLHVLRASPGDEVGLFNGRDGEWRARLASASKKGAVLGVDDRLREQRAELDLWLFFAPLKRGPVDLLIEKATELGVGALFPVWTERTDPQRINLDRLGAIAIEASEQCERLTVPEIHEPQRFNDVLSRWAAPRRLMFCDETGGGAPIIRAIAQLGTGPAAILVGPIGGFAQTELDALRALSFAVAADLGPRILRAETAAIAALACYQALHGEDPSDNPHNPR